MNFSEALDTFLRRKSRDLAIVKGAISSRTMETYRYRLEDFARFLFRKLNPDSDKQNREEPVQWEKFLQEIKIQEISEDDIANYLFECQSAGIAPPTINARLYTLRSFWKELSSIDSSITNITGSIPRARFRYERKPSITRDHLFQFISHLKAHRDKSRNGFRNYVLFNTIRLFGLRISEALNLKVESIHILDDSIKLEIIGKGNKIRVQTLPLKDSEKNPVEAAIEYRNCLEIYINNVRNQFLINPGEEDFLFISQAGNRWNEDSARIAFNKAMKSCQLNMHHYTPHSLRHAFVSHKLADGVPLQTVSRLVDHANVSITSSIYAHSEEKDLQEGMTRGLKLESEETKSKP